MNNKQKNLIKILLDANENITANSLASKIGVSIRSIMNYISEINFLHAGLIASSRSGYNINKNMAKKLLEFKRTNVPQTPEERVNYIIKTMLTKKSEFDKGFDLHEFANEMYVSVETVKKDIVKVKKKIVDFGLNIHMDTAYILLVGTERNKRKLISKAIYEEVGKSKFSVSAIQQIFHSYNVEKMYSIIIEHCAKQHYFVNDCVIINLILDIMISMDRIKNNDTISMPKEGEAEWKCREREITVQIAEEIERYYAIYYSEIEIDYLTEIMMSYLIPVDFQKISKTNIDKVAGITCMSIVNELFRYIKSNFYFINTENECFVVRFALHIKKLLCRLQSGHIINDPSKDDLKMSYPFIFECAVSIAWKLTQITGHKLTEDNIAYIAVHMGNNFVEQKSKTPKLCCCLLITHYYDYGEQVIEKISKQFENDIIILDILRVEKQINDFKNLDLIISTVSLPESFKTEWVRINPFVLEPDITRISRKIKSVMLAKKKQALYNALLKISNSNLFCKNLKRKNKITQNDVILFMKDILERDGYVDKDFDDAIVEREKYSSTAFGQIAVPHPIKMTAHKTGLFVMINDKPILWGKHEVNVILLFAINKNDWEVFSDVLDTLVALMLEIENLNKVMQCNTYEEFVDVVVSLVE